MKKLDDIVEWIVLIFSSISCLLNLIFICRILYDKYLRVRIEFLVLIPLMISIISINFAFISKFWDNLCLLQVNLFAYGDTSLFVWIFALVYFSYHSISFRDYSKPINDKIEWKKWIFFIFLGIIIPLAFGSGTYYLKIWEETHCGNWCCIDRKKLYGDVYVIIIYVYQMIMFLSVIIIFMVTYNYLKINNFDDRISLNRHIIIRIIVLIHSIGFLLTFFNRFFTEENIGEILYNVFQTMDMIIYSSYGIIYAIILCIFNYSNRYDNFKKFDKDAITNLVLKD